MNSKMMAAGIALAFVALALPSNAYHIMPNPPGGNGLEPREWGARASTGANFPVGDPATNEGDLCKKLRELAAHAALVNATLEQELQDLISILCIDEAAWNEGDVIFGLSFVACETNASDTSAAKSGAGGLCFMNPNFSDVGGVCTFSVADHGRSQGRFNDYTGGPCGAGAQPVIADDDVERAWYAIKMHLVSNPTLPTDNPVDFTGQIAGLDCDVASGTFVYDEQFAYTVADGHVAGFPEAEPVLPAWGTYVVTAYAGGTTPGEPSTDASLTNCAPYPFYY